MEEWRILSVLRQHSNSMSIQVFLLSSPSSPIRREIYLQNQERFLKTKCLGVEENMWPVWLNINPPTNMMCSTWPHSSILYPQSGSSLLLLKAEVCALNFGGCGWVGKVENLKGNLHRSGNARSGPTLWEPHQGRCPGESGGIPPGPSPFSLPSFLSSFRLSF